MGEECVYYYYDAGYCCALRKRKEGNSSIDSDTVKKYCWGYHYNDCPRYRGEKGGSTGSNCFLTSACVEAKGLPDDCYELTTLRIFRDGYLKSQSCGECEIAEYYAVAPRIVEKIRLCDNQMEIFDQIYEELVLPCVKFIEHGDNANAHELYRCFVRNLKRRYLGEE